MAAHDLSGLVCVRNLDVLLVSGFCPVTGNTVAVVTDGPTICLVVPEEARELAEGGWADRIETYKLGSLERVEEAPARLFGIVADLLRPLPNGPRRVGIEMGPAHLPASYVSMYVHGLALRRHLEQAFSRDWFAPSDDMLAALRARPTPWERARIRTACELAGEAFCQAAPAMQVQVPETNAVLPFRDAYVASASVHPEISRADSFFYCMSGPNAAAAWGAFQRSHLTPLRAGVPILIHCNGYADGYWTDLTRTYVLGEPDEQLRHIFDALARARDAALAAIRPGVQACAVDKAARDVLAAAGFGHAFKHPLGHGVGFTAIDHNEAPRIHPASRTVLEEDMVFNVEPGVYIDGYGGARDCNVVAVTADGCELLSPFQLAPGDWRIPLN
jgi:Xaa-Pro aminopeptidase